MKKVIVIAIIVIMTGNNVSIAGNISGTVIKESNGEPIDGLWIEAINDYTGQYFSGASTNPSGFFVIEGLDGTYRIMASTRNTDFVEEYYNDVYNYYDATPIYIPAYGEVQNINFSLKVGFKVSGKVTDKATGSALDNIRVIYWHNDFIMFTSVYTDIDGTYTLSRLLPGEVQIGTEPESYYGMIGARFELTEDINNLNFALPAGARLSGKVIDAETSQPLPGIEVTYWNDSTAVFQNNSSYGDGTFALTNLPPGVAYIKANPDIDTGYALWNLPIGSNLIYLNEGEDIPNQIIALNKGALVRGRIINPYGDPMSLGYQYKGRLCQGESETDVYGRYEIRLPVGTSVITVDEDGYGSLPREVNITDANLTVNVPPIIAYSEETGGPISGSVNNPGQYPKAGDFLIIALEAGAVIDPNSFYITAPISHTSLQNEGPFTITKLPPDIKCDVILCVVNETPDEIQSFTVRDSELDVPVGKTGVNLIYNSQGSTVTGKVLDTYNQPVLGATVLFSDLATGSFAGWEITDYKGNYVLYNVPDGEYNVTAIRSKCLSQPITVPVIEGEPVIVSPIVMLCDGE